MGIIETVAENVHSYRKISGLTQAQLAEKSGTQRTFIGAIEQKRSNPTLRSVEKIVNALDIEAALLFTRMQGGYDAEAREHAERRLLADVRIPPFPLEDFALCKFTRNGVELRHIKVYDEDITVRLLCGLINAGHTADLADAYSDAIDEVMEVFERRRVRRTDRKVRKFVEDMDNR